MIHKEADDRKDVKNSEKRNMAEFSNLDNCENPPEINPSSKYS